MASNASNVVISPINVLWQIEAADQYDFTGILSTDLDGKFFNISSAKDATLHYVWFDLDAGSLDPAPAGRTAIEVDIITADSASVIAGKVQAAIDAIGDYTATVDGTVVSNDRTAVGVVTDAVDVDSGVAITICRRGQDFDLGLLDGDVEMNFSPSNFIVQAQQTGVTPRAALYQGIETLEATTSLLETQQSQLNDLYGLYGTTGFTPGGGTSVFGVGTSKQGENLLIDAARLIMKPVNSTDDLENTNLMLAIPVPDTLLFSGENPRTLGVTWQGFVDETKDSRISALLFGDAAQSGL